MKPQQTQGIVLSRTDFGEADRIITVITPDQGKRRLMVRGVRRMKSKLAGGIELFSVSDLTYIKGRGEIDTLISARLVKYYSTIVEDIDRVQLGYELIKTLNRATEDEPEAEYFELLKNSFSALDSNNISQELIKLWFQAQLLKLAGHTPNLKTDSKNDKLTENDGYIFDFEAMLFTPKSGGKYTSDDIKFLRLVFSDHSPAYLNKIKDSDKLTDNVSSLIRTMLTTNIRT